MSAKVYIDGHAGTTGLRIRDWLQDRSDISLITLPEALRKNTEARQEAVQAADVAILCLPDEAARQIAQWPQANETCLIDASTAHRTDPNWVYGLAEMSPEQRERIRQSRRISNPGCYSSTAILLLKPLLDAGLVSAEQPRYIHALSGYSGGGRQLIEKWQAPEQGLINLPFEAPYAYTWTHKHISEIQHYWQSQYPPHFIPAVGPFYSGMRVQLPLHAAELPEGIDAQAIHACLHARYEQEPFVQVQPLQPEGPFDERSFDPRCCDQSNQLHIHVLANPSGHVSLVGLLDNLGKGASGMAIQNLNLVLGQDERLSLLDTTA